MTLINTMETMHKKDAVFSSDLSEKYAPVKTSLLLTPFFNKGWEVYKERKQLSKDGIGTEHLILRHKDYVYTNGDFLTIECLNSNNGSKALMLMGGYGRIACANGLVIGDMKGGRFIHRGTSIYEKLNNKYDEIIMHLDKMRTDFDRLKEKEPSSDDYRKIILNIAKDIFEKDTKTSKIEVTEIPSYIYEGLLRPRRQADFGKDAFTVMNVIQEKIIRTGLLRANIVKTSKESGNVERLTVSKQRSENKISSIGLNKIITENFLKAI